MLHPFSKSPIHDSCSHKNNPKEQNKTIFNSQMNLLIDLNFQEELESWEDEVDGVGSSREVI